MKISITAPGFSWEGESTGTASEAVELKYRHNEFLAFLEKVLPEGRGSTIDCSGMTYEEAKEAVRMTETSDPEENEIDRAYREHRNLEREGEG